MHVYSTASDNALLSVKGDWMAIKEKCETKFHLLGLLDIDIVSLWYIAPITETMTFFFCLHLNSSSQCISAE